ncbi:MAG: hypothetical protein U1A27_08700 [Phycisphaerae bacterium]
MRRSFLMLEAMLAAAIVAIAAAAAAIPFAAGLNAVTDAHRIEKAVLLAEAMLAEIRARPFEDPNTPTDHTLGPDAGESTRTAYDNVDDFHGLSESAGAMKSMAGTTISDSDLASFYRTVSVQYVTMPGQLAWDSYAFALVTVTVNDNRGPVVTVKRLLAREY